MKKAIFLDRDGVINENVKDLTKLSQIKLIPNVAEAIKKINDSGYLVIIITNQPIIAKGFCTFEDIEKIHMKIKGMIAKIGGHIDRIYMCPHHPERGFEVEVVELKINCLCRKPKPGLFLQAIKELNINPKTSWSIGDSLSDIAASKKAGIKSILLISGGGSGSKQEFKLRGIKADYVKADLLEA